MDEYCGLTRIKDDGGRWQVPKYTKETPLNVEGKGAHVHSAEGTLGLCLLWCNIGNRHCATAYWDGRGGGTVNGSLART